MKVLQIHNHYGSHSGETTVFDVQKELLEKYGHTVIRYIRSSKELDTINFGKFIAFTNAIYSPSSIRDVLSTLKSQSPDIVHIHNLYPLISPSILPSIRKEGIPVVMTVHNYRLVCPNGLFYNKKGICECCAGGKEWNCLLQNCEESYFKSLGYTLRNAWARLAGYYKDNVNAFLCLTEFQKRKLIENGFPESKCHIIPNFTVNDPIRTDEDSISLSVKKGFLFIGRLNRQKGIDTLVAAARKCPDISFIIAGSVDKTFIDTNSFPNNVKWLGVVSNESITRLLHEVKALVFTSRSYEGFPMVFLEAMQQGVPVVAPNLAGFPEIIREGINGWLFGLNDADDLARVLRMIEDDKSSLIDTAGQRGKEILLKEYSSEVWYREYIKITSALINKSGSENKFICK
jgi:glycosyltransferase involved in cell wall biosynthesis